MDQAIDQANQANNAAMWVLFTVVIIAPLLVLFVSVLVAIVAQRKLKCPECGNWRKNKKSGVQTIRTVEGNNAVVTTQRVVICRKCKNEFTV